MRKIKGIPVQRMNELTVKKKMMETLIFLFAFFGFFMLRTISLFQDVFPRCADYL